MSEARQLIHLENVAKVFLTEDMETHALVDVHLDIRQGEYVSISGPSGCGKSTLLAILGLLDSPSTGEYVLNGKPVQGLKLSERARIRNREIGFIFQAFNLIGDLTVYENVELPLTYRGMPGADRKKKVHDALERVGMSHRVKHYPSQLSGGQQQRVAVARALAEIPRFCWPMNLPAISIRLTAKPSWNCCASCIAAARPSAWSRTIPAMPRLPTAIFVCLTAASSRRASQRSQFERIVGMQYQQLGNTGIFVSRLCLGRDDVRRRQARCWKAIGGLGQHDTRHAGGRIHRSRHQLLRYRECLLARANRRSMLGKALGARRPKMVIATKVFGRMGQGPNEVGLSRLHIMREAEASLPRLGTDYIDLYQIHGFDH